MTKVSLKEYLIYFFVGSFVGIIAVLVRELIAFLTKDTPVFYFISVITVYFFGILLSFFMHKRITYRIITTDDLKEKKQKANFGNFTLIALLGMLLTGIFSLLLRYGLHFDSFVGIYAGAVAFILAAILTSVITYFLHSHFSFIR